VQILRQGDMGLVGLDMTDYTLLRPFDRFLLLRDDCNIRISRIFFPLIRC
jgi:hypothetical protein